MDIGCLTIEPLWDVAILGGGAAGLACAIEAAQLGLSAIVIDRNDGRLRPGECLHPGVASLLRRLGLGQAIESIPVPRPMGVWHTKCGADLRFSPYGQDEHGPWQGYQLRRSLLIRLLTGRAKELSVQRLTFKGKAELLYSNGNISGLAVEHRTVRAGFVIDAAGSSHWIARRLGICVHKLSRPLYARWGYVRRIGTSWDYAPWLDMQQSGWIWRARVGADLHAWVELFDALKHPQAPHMGTDAYPLCQSRGSDASWRVLDRCAGRGWMAVGDAAAVLDPISGDGVLRALTSGIAAAASAAAALSGATLSTIGQDDYSVLLRAGVIRRAEQLRQHVPWA